MSKSLSLVSLALVLFGGWSAGCVITDDGDDGAGDTGGSASNATASASNATASATNASASNATASASATDDGSSSGTTPAETGAESSTETSLGDASTGSGGACGWGVTGEKAVPMGYVCGGDGEDPSGLMPMGCPEGIDLVEGGDCGGNMGITGVGCCDAAGDVWYCADDGGGAVLFTSAC